MELPDKNWTLLAKLPTFFSTYLKNNKSNCYAILEIPKLKRVLIMFWYLPGENHADSKWFLVDYSVEDHKKVVASFC